MHGVCVCVCVQVHVFVSSLWARVIFGTFNFFHLREVVLWLWNSAYYHGDAVPCIIRL